MCQGTCASYLRQILPDPFLSFAFSFPPLTDDLRDLRVCETWIAGNDGLLVVLTIKNKSYKESAADEYLSANKDSIPLFDVTLVPWDTGNKETIGLTIPGAGYLRFGLAETDLS